MKLSADEAAEINHSSVWKMVVRELEYRIKLTERSLRTCEVEDLKAIQAELRTLESIKNLPDSIKERDSA